MPGDAVEAENFWRMRGMLKYFFWTHDAQDFEASCLWLMQIHPSMVRLWFSAKPSVSCCCKAASLHWSAEQMVWDHPGAIYSDPALGFWDSSKMLLLCFKLSKQQKPQKTTGATTKQRHKETCEEARSAERHFRATKHRDTSAPTDHKASPKLLSPQNKIVPTRFSLKVTLRPEIHISPELIFQEVKTSLDRMVPLSHSKSCIFIFAPQRKHQVYAFPKMIFPLNQYFVKKMQ